MPIPTPEKNEEQSVFIGRCNSILNNEYSNSKQRNAICYSQWEKSKKDSSGINDSVDRNVSFNIDSQSNLKLDELTGFLYGKARVTRSGVFDYYDEKGNLLREYRSPEEVFDKDSMESLALKPIVNDHPDKMVTVDNIKELQVGSIGDSVEKDDQFILSNIVITDKDTVSTILNRKKIGLSTELSCGYNCTLIPEIGNHDKDGYYTFVQKNIRYNHVGIVDRARAGKEVRILDKHTNKKENNMPDKIQFTRKAINLDSFKVDSINETFDSDVINIITTLSDKLDEAVDIIVDRQKEKDILQGKFDQANENIITLNSKINTLSNIDSQEAITMFNERTNVYSIAEKLNVECKDKKINEIKIDCIKKISEGFNQDGKSPEYINARFDAINDTIFINKDKDNKETYKNFMKNVKDSSKNNTKEDPRTSFIKKDKEQNRK